MTARIEGYVHICQMAGRGASVTACDNSVMLVDRDAPFNKRLNVSTVANAKKRRMQTTSSLTPLPLGLSGPCVPGDATCLFSNCGIRLRRCSGAPFR